MNEEKVLGEAIKAVLTVLIEQAKDLLPYFRGKKRTKKNSKNTIGIVFAIETHNPDEYERLHADLIKPLKHELQKLSSEDIFNLIELTAEEAERVDTPQEASRVLAQKRAHMMIYGDLTVREMNGDSQHVFRLHGIVRHTPIPKVISNRFSVDFQELLPELTGSSIKNEIGFFEVKRLEISYVIKYVIGVAAALSLDLTLGRKLLESLLKELSTIPDVDTAQPFAKFYTFSRQRLAEIFLLQLNIAYARFRKTRDKNEILKMEKELNQLYELDQDNYRASLFRSMFLFFSDRVDDSINELSHTQNSDVVWRYSLGFLYAYSDRIEEALVQYNKTHHHPVLDEGILLDIEIFISEVIEQRPEKIQLLFFRGLINHKQKEDRQLAKKDFENFLSKSDGVYPPLETLAKKYLSRL